MCVINLFKDSQLALLHDANTYLCLSCARVNDNLSVSFWHVNDHTHNMISEFILWPGQVSTTIWDFPSLISTTCMQQTDNENASKASSIENSRDRHNQIIPSFYQLLPSISLNLNINNCTLPLGLLGRILCTFSLGSI